MFRALTVIMLAVVCGSAAAIGVFQMVSKRTKQVESEKNKTKTVVVASRTIDRGSVLSPADVKMVDWPKESVLSGTESHVENVIGRVVLVSFVQNEPLLKAKLSRDEGVSFFSSIIKMGMRAYTIQTTGPSSTVAGFVRPGDYVDVMLYLRGSTSDETGGGSTTTLLQAIGYHQHLDQDYLQVRKMLSLILTHYHGKGQMEPKAKSVETTQHRVP